MTEVQPAPRRREVATSAGVLWLGTLLFGSSTVLLLAALSRHSGPNGFVGLSALLGLAFVGSVLPAGLHLRSAAMVADGHGLPKAPLGAMVALGAGGLALAPFSGRLLHVPPAAVIFLLVQILLSFRLVIVRGAFLGTQQFDTLGKNLAGEGVCRVVLGTALGLVFGVTGLAVGMLGATMMAMATLPDPPQRALTTARPTTSLLDTSVALALVGLLVQLDVLLAPSLLSNAAANQYDLAAVPSKGVYSALLAAGPLVFPFVRSQSKRRHASPESTSKWVITQAAVGTVALGVVITAALALLRPVIGLALGKAEPGLGLLVILGLAMSLGGGTALLANAGVARGIARPWPPVAAGTLALVGIGLTGPTALQFGLATTAVWGLVAGGTLWISLYGTLRSPTLKSRFAAPRPSVGERASRALGPQSDRLRSRLTYESLRVLRRLTRAETGAD